MHLFSKQDVSDLERMIADLENCAKIAHYEPGKKVPIPINTLEKWSVLTKQLYCVLLDTECR